MLLILSILIGLGSFGMWFMTLLSDPCSTQESKDVANTYLKIGLPIAALFFVGWYFKL